MKSLGLRVLGCFVWSVFCCFIASPISTQVWAQTSIDFRRAESPIDNPLKGLVPYAGTEHNQFPHSMEFSYIPLSDLVRGEGKFEFAPLEKLLDEVKSRGNQTIFRVMLEYPGKKDLIPRYLIENGLNIHKYLNTNTAPFPPQQIETPDYEDPALRKCLTQFVSALGKRYDGDPRIAYITAGLLGTWGEWHTYPKTELWASKTVQREILDAYQTAFSKTSILLRYPAGKEDHLYAETSSYPFGYHDDSFAYATQSSGKANQDWFFLEKLKSAKCLDVWKRHPIGGEIRPELWGCCFDEEPCQEHGQSFAACRDATHVSWLMDSGMFQEQVSESRLKNAEQEVRKMGYDFFVKSLSTQKIGDSLQLRIKVVNTGIAPFYQRDWHPHLALFDTEQKKIVKRWHTDWLLTGILPGAKSSREWKTDLVLLQSNELILLLGIPNPMEGGKALRFANETQDQHLDDWMSLGRLEQLR